MYFRLCTILISKLIHSSWAIIQSAWLSKMTYTEGRTPEAQNQRKFDTKSWLLPSQCGLRGAGKARAALSFYLPLSTDTAAAAATAATTAATTTSNSKAATTTTATPAAAATGQTLLDAPPTSPLATRLALHTLFPLGFPFPAISGLRVC